METLLLALLHALLVTAVYVSAYRTGYAVCEKHTRRRVEACTAPLTEMLAQLNLDIEQIMDDPSAREKDTRHWKRLTGDDESKRTEG